MKSTRKTTPDFDSVSRGFAIVAFALWALLLSGCATFRRRPTPATSGIGPRPGAPAFSACRIDFGKTTRPAVAHRRLLNSLQAIQSNLASVKDRWDGLDYGDFEPTAQLLDVYACELNWYRSLPDVRKDPALAGLVVRLQLECKVLRLGMRYALAQEALIQELYAAKSFSDFRSAINGYLRALEKISTDGSEVMQIQKTVSEDKRLLRRFLRDQECRLQRLEAREQRVLRAQQFVFCGNRAEDDLRKAHDILEQEEREWWADADDLVVALILVERVERSPNVPDLLRRQASVLHGKIASRFWLFLPSEGRIYRSRPRLHDYTEFEDYPRWSPSELAEELWLQQFRQMLEHPGDDDQDAPVPAGVEDTGQQKWIDFRRIPDLTDAPPVLYRGGQSG